MIKYKYEINERVYDEIKIYKELMRKNIFEKIYNIFYNFIIELKKKNKLDVYKLLKYKLREYVSMWFWEQDLKEDSVIPFLAEKRYKYFLECINFYLKKSFAENILQDLKNKINSEFYKLYQNFKNKKNINLRIKKKIIGSYIKLETEFENKIYSIDIKKKLYKQLKKKYKYFNKDNNYKKYIFCLCFRYFYIDASNQQLAIIPQIKKKFKKIGVNFELFGSAINTFSKYYCSLYYDIEKFFGSRGSFFNIILKEGIYWCNPPYNNDIMTDCSLKLIKSLDNNNIGFLITIPIWDQETKKYIKDKILFNYNKEKNKELFKDYPIYYNLKDYIKYELIIPQFKIPYYNYKEDQFINAIDTYIIFISNNIETKLSEAIYNIFTNIIKKYN